MPFLFKSGNIVQPIASVITPTYNHEAFIGECIQSVISQTIHEWEMIIIDDGSTDGTADAVGQLADPRIKYIRQENKGVGRLGETYNTALAHARGGVIGILEGDDWWPPEKLAIQLSDFADERVVLSSGFTEIIQDGRPDGRTPVDVPPEEYASNRPVGRAALFMLRPDTELTFTFPVSTMVRTSALRAIGGFQQPEYLPLVDFPTFLRLTLEGQFRFHNRTLGYWRRHSQSITKGNLSAILENAYRYAFEFIRQYRDRIPASDEELDRLEAAWDEVALMRCVLRGRILSKEYNRALAARAFREALLYRHSPRTALIVQTAALLASLGLPVEPIYKATGRKDLHGAITLSTGDQTVSVEDMNRPRVVGRWR